MSRISRVPSPQDQSADVTPDPKSEAIVKAMSELIKGLSATEQDRVLRQLTQQIRPISAPRAGDTLGALIRFLPRRVKWTVEEVKQEVASAGIEASPKEIYNALGYLARKGQIRRIGYGRYLVDGAGMLTSTEFGGEPTRYEDE